MDALSSVRALTKRYPTLRGTGLVNRIVERFVRREPWRETPAWGRCPKLVLDLRSPIQRKLFLFPRAWGDFYLDHDLCEALVHMLPPGGTFLDVGANIGLLSIYAARLVGETGKVVAFEPFPSVLESLRRSVDANDLPQVSWLDVALSDREGELSFFIAECETASSLSDKPPDHCGYDREIAVRVTSLDTLVAGGELELERLDFVKIDVEGEEARTVRGMRETLRRFEQPRLWIEVRGPERSHRANTFPEVYELLAELGYRAFRRRGRSEEEVRPGDVSGLENLLFRV